MGMMQETQKTQDYALPFYEWEYQEYNPTVSQRYMHLMEYNSDARQVVMWGGHGFFTRNWTWAWDGTGWEVRATVCPRTRGHAAMAYMKSTQTMMMFGGVDMNLQVLGETWGLNGSTWDLITTEGPTPRIGHDMVYDEARDEIILFGGRDLSCKIQYNDTWSWTTEYGWRLLTTDVSPSPRAFHAMVYDSKREIIVMTGGSETCRIVALPKVWEWNGQNWKEIPNNGPARAAHRLVYDSHRKVTIMFGGYDEVGTQHNDIWEWNGHYWKTTATNQLIPLPRSSHGMAYDENRNMTLMYGGVWNAVGDLGDTWKLKRN
ncbi:hypothetical protein LCGC14_1192450 [marine sediment metagenome]|uniref:Uncharacterized protein n=1 Tax=marine sediment metagenome TaxID=412755 RepID=A0A0F9LJ54_9ZZZZ